MKSILPPLPDRGRQAEMSNPAPAVPHLQPRCPPGATPAPRPRSRPRSPPAVPEEQAQALGLERDACDLGSTEMPPLFTVLGT